MQTKESRLALLCLLPAALLLVAVFLYPIVNTLLDAFAPIGLTGRQPGFTMDNWKAVLSDNDFMRGALPRTFVWTIGVVALTILLSLPAALLLQEEFGKTKWVIPKWKPPYFLGQVIAALKYPLSFFVAVASLIALILTQIPIVHSIVGFIGKQLSQISARKIARTLFLLPWAVPLPISAIFWKFIFDGQQGTLNGLLEAMGGHGTVWLAEAKTALPVLIWVGVWASIPFTTVTLLAGLQGIGGDVLEAASLDGADGWRRFRFIILPLLRPVLNVAVVLNTIYVFNSFPIIWVMTKGEPANGTHTLITYLYQQAFVSSQTGAAQAMGVLSFGVLMVFSMLYLRVAEKEVA